MHSTRDRLLAAAADLLDEGGPTAVKLREVGRLAGVSHNAPYKHFHDKDAILSAIATEALDALTLELRRAIDESADHRAAMIAVGRTYADWASAHPARFKLTFGPWAIADDALGVAASTARATFLEPFAAAAAAKILTMHADDAAALVWAVAHGAVDLDLGGHLEKDGLALRPHDLIDRQVVAITTAV